MHEDRHGRRGREPRGRGPEGRGRPDREGARGPRGPRARLSREDIVRAALEIAEREGIRAVSMRKVARQLGAGTMSLYHYVRTKDDLLALMDDALMGELVIPEEEMPDGWRERVALIAKLSLAAWRRRPWMVDLDDGFRITENGMRHMEQTIGALDGLDVSPALKFEIMSQVDDYLFGFVARERQVDLREMGSEAMAEITGFVRERIRSGAYPNLEQMIGPDGDFDRQWLDLLDEIYDDGRFERGLNRLLDGIEAELTRMGALPG